MTKNWRKIIKLIFFAFCSTTAIYLSLGLHTGLPSYRRSLQPSKENIRGKNIFVGHFCPPGSGSTTLISTVGSENESGYKISFEWLLPQGPPTVEYHKNNKNIRISGRQGLYWTYGGEHIAGVRTQLTPFRFHPGSTTWNISHFYSNMVFTSNLQQSYRRFLNIIGIRYAESRTRFYQWCCFRIRDFIIRIRNSGLRIRILLFSSENFKMPTIIFFSPKILVYNLPQSIFTSVLIWKITSYFCLLIERPGSGSAQIITDPYPGDPNT